MAKPRKSDLTEHGISRCLFFRGVPQTTIEGYCDRKVCTSCQKV